MSVATIAARHNGIADHIATHQSTPTTYPPTPITESPPVILSPDYIDSIAPGPDMDWVIARERMGMIGQSLPRYSTNTHHAMLIALAYPELCFQLIRIEDEFSAAFYRDGDRPEWGVYSTAAMAICRGILRAKVGKVQLA
jgi:hypothetical protein